MFYKLVFDRGKGSLECFYSQLSGCGSWFQSHDAQGGTMEDEEYRMFRDCLNAGLCLSFLVIAIFSFAILIKSYKYLIRCEHKFEG